MFILTPYPLQTVTCRTCVWVAHSVKPLCLNVAGSGFESREAHAPDFKRWCGMKLCRICFCCKHCTSVVMLCCFDLLVIQTSIAQIYNAPGLEYIDFFHAMVIFIWTSVLICFFYVRSASAVLLFPLFPGSAPGIAACSYIRGRARRARPLLLLYVLLLLLLLLLLLFFFSSNGSLWQPYEGNMGKWWNLAHS